MLYMFTYEHQKQYAVLKAMGADGRTVLTMVFVQAGTCALLGTGIGIGLCGLAGEAVMRVGYPFRMMWFTPLAGILGVVAIALVAAAISARPILRLQPAIVFAGR
jgi:putative ABC transport system permease protein